MGTLLVLLTIAGVLATFWQWFHVRTDIDGAKIAVGVEAIVMLCSFFGGFLFLPAIALPFLNYMLFIKYNYFKDFMYVPWDKKL